MSSASLAPLVELGFTSLEAEVYSWLLEEAPATGYRIAQALRKPAPNIYKSLESLESKGAVIVDEGARRVCRPLPPDEVLGHLERTFHERKKRAALALAELSGPERDDRVWRLRSAEAVFERARAMLARAEQVAFADAFPAALATLAPALEETAERGIAVGVHAYEPTTLRGPHVVTDARGPDTRERWPGEWLCLVVDGAEHLVAFLSPDLSEVRQAIWTGSAHLSWVYHSAHAAEFILTAVEAAARNGADAATLHRTLAEFSRWRTLEAPGYRDLRRRTSESSNPRGEES